MQQCQHTQHAQTSQEKLQKISDTDLLTNKENMSRLWNSDAPILTAYEQIEEEMKFAKQVGVASQDKEKMAIAF